MLCITCEQEIPAERLEILPHTKTCVKCSNEKKKVGFMDFGHKTAPVLVVINPENSEDLRRATRVFNRSR